MRGELAAEPVEGCTRKIWAPHLDSVGVVSLLVQFVDGVAAAPVIPVIQLRLGDRPRVLQQRLAAGVAARVDTESGALGEAGHWHHQRHPGPSKTHLKLLLSAWDTGKGFRYLNVLMVYESGGGG